MLESELTGVLQHQLDRNSLFRSNPVLRNVELSIAGRMILGQPEAGFIRDGQLTRERFEQTQGMAFVPSPELLDAVIFAGEGSYEGLKKKAFEQLDILGQTFSLKTSNQPDSRLIHTPFNTQGIKDVYNLVEHAMHALGKRNTGEEPAAHIARGIIRAVDFIHLLNERWNQGEASYPFSAMNAQKFILSHILHDLGEDHAEVKVEGYNTRKSNIGKLVYIDEPTQVDELHPYGGYWVDRFDPASFDPHAQEWKDRKPVVLESVPLPLPQVEADEVYEVVDILNKKDIEKDVEAVEKILISIARRQEGTLGFTADQFTKFIMPLLVKMLDGVDNALTRTYRRDGDQYVANGIDGIVRKANEFIDTWLPFENLIHRLAGNRSVYFEPSLNIKFNKKFINQYSDSEIIQFMPSRWAILTLLGYGPNEILGTSSHPHGLAVMQ